MGFQTKVENDNQSRESLRKGQKKVVPRALALRAKNQTYSYNYTTVGKNEPKQRI